MRGGDEGWSISPAILLVMLAAQGAFGKQLSQVADTGGSTFISRFCRTRDDCAPIACAAASVPPTSTCADDGTDASKLGVIPLSAFSLPLSPLCLALCEP